MCCDDDAMVEAMRDEQRQRVERAMVSPAAAAFAAQARALRSARVLLGDANEELLNYQYADRNLIERIREWFIANPSDSSGAVSPVEGDDALRRDGLPAPACRRQAGGPASTDGEKP